MPGMGSDATRICMDQEAGVDDEFLVDDEEALGQGMFLRLRHYQMSG